jgi:hypothetical protein
MLAHIPEDRKAIVIIIKITKTRKKQAKLTPAHAVPRGR